MQINNFFQYLQVFALVAKLQLDKQALEICFVAPELPRAFAKEISHIFVQTLKHYVSLHFPQLLLLHYLSLTFASFLMPLRIRYRYSACPDMSADILMLFIWIIRRSNPTSAILASSKGLFPQPWLPPEEEGWEENEDIC